MITSTIDIYLNKSTSKVEMWRKGKVHLNFFIYQTSKARSVILLLYKYKFLQGTKHIWQCLQVLNSSTNEGYKLKQEHIELTGTSQSSPSYSFSEPRTVEVGIMDPIWMKQYKDSNIVSGSIIFTSVLKVFYLTILICSKILSSSNLETSSDLIYCTPYRISKANIIYITLTEQQYKASIT